MPERQSKATQGRHERMLLELLKLPGNDRCADCKAKSKSICRSMVSFVDPPAIRSSMGILFSRYILVYTMCWSPSQNGYAHLACKVSYYGRVVAGAD